LINNQWVIAEIRKEIKSILKVNEDENTIKAVLRGKFIAMSAYIKRKERSQINYLMLHLKLLEEQEQAKPKKAEGEK
jgi:hypothetical protein